MQSEINVTPLVDVCLVLLIIFMVLTPAMVAGSSVALPETRHSNESASAPLSVTVMADETILVGDAIVRREEVATELQRRRTLSATGSVAVRGDKRVTYGAVAEVLDACRAAGWSDVKLVSLKAPAL